MKVKIGPYKNWFGPYQLAEKILFFIPKQTDEFGFKHTSDLVHKFGEFLAYGKIYSDDSDDFFDSDRKSTWLFNFLIWIDSKRKRTENIHIDRWDTWSMDHTLALIIVPMLKQLKETKHGAPMVDIFDVPEHLRPTPEEEKKFNEDGTTDEKFFARWDYVMDEMIFAFEKQLDESWKDEFSKGKIEMKSVPCEWDENGKPTLYLMEEGPNHTYECDYEGIKKVQERIDNGLRLFGKYYQSLWD